MQGLAQAERHGKRVDAKGQSRQMRDIDPLVHGGLNLRERFDAHTKGVRFNKAARKPVGHLLFQFPTGLKLANERNEKWLLSAAVGFAEQVYGGEAVFAGRLDRDEKNRHVVDVFIGPKYTKRTKASEAQWSSIGQWHQPLCHKHRAEIERRHNGRFNRGPRAQGMALQSELIGYLRGLGLDIDDKIEKESPVADRVEPEVYADERIAQAEAAERQAADRLALAAQDGNGGTNGKPSSNGPTASPLTVYLNQLPKAERVARETELRQRVGICADCRALVPINSDWGCGNPQIVATRAKCPIKACGLFAAQEAAEWI